MSSTPTPQLESDKPQTNTQTRNIRALPLIGSLPSATQAFLVALGVLGLMALVSAFFGAHSDDKSSDFIRPVVNGSMDLCKVLVGAFAGSLTGRRAMSD